MQKELWPLSLSDAIHTALPNAGVMRKIGAVVEFGESNEMAIARSNTDISLIDFESLVRNLVSEVENNYWELSFAYHNLDIAVEARDDSLRTWQKAHSNVIKGTKEGGAAYEAQSREQNFGFKVTAEQAKVQVYHAESRLRSLMGIPATDGRWIRPDNVPATSKTSFDRLKARSEALSRSPELRNIRWRIKQRELELRAAEEYLRSHPDSEKTKSGVANAAAALAREQAKLHATELDVSHQLADAITDMEASYKTTVTSFARFAAAERNLKAVRAAYDSNVQGVTFDVLLEAQRTLAEADSSYFRSLINYAKSVSKVHLCKGSLLQRDGVRLAEGQESGEPPKPPNSGTRADATKDAAAGIASETKSAPQPSATNCVDEGAAALVRAYYASRTWIDKARSFNIHADCKITTTAEGIRWEEKHPNPYLYSEKSDPRPFYIAEDWAWDESHVLHTRQSHHEGEKLSYQQLNSWDGSLGIACDRLPGPEQYVFINKVDQLFGDLAVFALLPWGPGDGFTFWWSPRCVVPTASMNQAGDVITSCWSPRDVAEFRAGCFIAPEDFQLAGQEEVNGKSCHVLQSRAGQIRLYLGTADGRLYRREILVAPSGGPIFLAHCQKIGGPAIKTVKQWWDWEEALKPQERVKAYRLLQEANFDIARLCLRQTFDDYREVLPGCWLSFRQTIDSYEIDASKPFLWDHDEQTISDVTVNQPIPPGRFVIKLTEGAQVDDRRYDPPISYAYKADQTEAERKALSAALRRATAGKPGDDPAAKSSADAAAGKAPSPPTIKPKPHDPPGKGTE